MKNVYYFKKANSKHPQGSNIFRLSEHTKRLFDSAKIVGMNIPYSEETLSQAQKEVIKKNNLTEAYIRPMCFYGAEGMGLRADNLSTNVIIAAWEWGAYLSTNQNKGIRICTSSYNRHHVNVSMCKAKVNGQYVNSMLALREALERGFDEALMLDTNGFVSEGSAENIFIVKDNTIYTPDPTSCLTGITRHTVIQIAKHLGFEVIEKPITRDEVYISDEAFFTGTASEIAPIESVDNRLIGESNPITKQIATLYHSVVTGQVEKFSSWNDII